MRLKKEKIDIDYTKTKEFFDSRDGKYRKNHPYVTTMYQDAHPQLTEARNEAEVGRICPLLQLDKSSRVLDLGCGIGRWADAIDCEIAEYFGVDFSEGLISIARERNTRANFSYETMSICDFGEYFLSHNLKHFNCLIIAGVLVYLNDSDVERLFRLFSDILVPGALIYLRVPVGIQERLTLKDFYSEELAHEYHSIYRTDAEYRKMLEKNAPDFTICQADFLFERPALNNRKETSQYFYILKKMNRLQRYVTGDSHPGADAVRRS